MSDLYSKRNHPGGSGFWPAMAALGLHLGGAALALAHLRTDDGDDGLGANGAEYAVEMASPKLPETDLPPGPDSEASQFQPQQIAAAGRGQRDRSSEGNASGSRRPRPPRHRNNSKKPVEDTTKVAKVETQAVEEMPNAQESARQALNEDAREDEKAAGPNQGIGKDIRKLTAEWGKRISAYFELHKRYPKDKSKTTTVKLSLASEPPRQCRCPSTWSSPRAIPPSTARPSPWSAARIPCRSPAGRPHGRSVRASACR